MSNNTKQESTASNTRSTSIVRTASVLMFAGLCLALASQAKAQLVIDKKTGQYKDLSYEALSDEGLSWEERTRLFGGETVHYGELTDEQRKAKQQELDGLLKRIDRKLVASCEADIRKWLDPAFPI